MTDKKYGIDENKNRVMETLERNIKEFEITRDGIQTEVLELERQLSHKRRSLNRVDKMLKNYAESLKLLEDEK